MPASTTASRSGSPRRAPVAPVRRTRFDGERSRRRILDSAARLATVDGLDRLSIGDLAADVGISKSGLYAHFGSKEELAAGDDRSRRGDLRRGRRGTRVGRRAGHPGRPGPRGCVPRPPRGPDLPGRLLLRLRLGGGPGPVRAREGPDRGVRSPLAAAVRSSSLDGGPGRRGPCPPTRTSSSCSSRSTPTCCTPTRRMPSAATASCSSAPRSRSAAASAWRRPRPERRSALRRHRRSRPADVRRCAVAVLRDLDEARAR